MESKHSLSEPVRNILFAAINTTSVRTGIRPMVMSQREGIADAGSEKKWLTKPTSALPMTWISRGQAGAQHSNVLSKLDQAIANADQTRVEPNSFFRGMPTTNACLRLEQSSATIGRFGECLSGIRSHGEQSGRFTRLSATPISSTS